MTELSREAQRLIQEARELGLPAPADKTRVLAKLKAAAAAASAPAAGGVAAKAAIVSAVLLVVGLSIARSGQDRSGQDPAVRERSESTDDLRPQRPKFANTKLEAQNVPIAAPPVRNPTPVERRRAASRPVLSDISDAPEATQGSLPETIESNQRAREQPAAGPQASELELMRRARVALRDGDAETALALVEEHERDFPDSVLIEERWTTRALAACALGKYEIADTAIAALVERAPRSEHLARIQRVCQRSSE